MPMKDGFTPGHSLPRFLSEHADDPDLGKAWDRAIVSSQILKTSVLVVTASLIAILLVESPAAVVANVVASLVDISSLQPGSALSTPAIQSTSDAQPLPPTASAVPARDEIVVAGEPADQSQTEVSGTSADALFKQFQAWAVEKDAQAQAGSAQPIQDAPARIVQNAPARASENTLAPVRPLQTHRHARAVQNARAETRPVQHARKPLRREQNARAQAPPPQEARAQGQPAQNAQTPSFFQTLGWHN